MTFNEYLVSKKIDSSAFEKHEPEVWKTWRNELEQMSAVSFTAQKLYLINPMRRRFPFVDVIESVPIASPDLTPAPAKPTAPAAKPVMKARPVFNTRPKPPEE